ncbi:MAG: hypothetical protein HOO06_03310 [Bdellovibrionaceae bacterium]|nr:hypothetical protein [Pseudobdellovibrionaceae bacterium]
MAKKNIKKILLSFAVLSLFTALEVSAGYSFGSSVNLGSNYFRGTISKVRSTNNSTELLICQITSNYSYCMARNSSGTYKSCSFSNNDEIKQIALGLNEMSHIQVGFDSRGICTYMTLLKGSLYIK